MATPIYFNRPRMRQLNRDPHAGEVLAGLDGFEAIATSYQRANVEFDIPPKPSVNDAAERLLAGEPLADLAERFALEHRTFEEARKSAGVIRESARNQHDSLVDRFLFYRHGEVLAGILLGYERVKAQAVELLPNFVEISSREDAIANPEGAAVFGLMQELAADLMAWRRTAQLFTGDDARGRGPFPYLDLLADYPTSWPTFHRHTRETKVLEHRKTSISTPVERAPWPDEIRLLLDIARRDLPLWAPSTEELQTRTAELDAAAYKARTAELARMQAAL